ncbi:MAG: aldo/keto reductase [Spirochaetales bacterium]|jgi:uncharacterized protein|nr:aldo/keto reductase [Spirochaetales bacterium]
MNYVTFGKTGEKVSALGMGGMRWTDEITDESAVAAIHRANELGVNYFDTAPGYCADRSEPILGKALASMPNDNWLVATKGSNSYTADEVTKKIEASLERLGVDAIDFYFLWCIITDEAFEKSISPGQCLEGILKAYDQGLIRHVGVSSHMVSSGLKKIVDHGAFEFLMVPYNAMNFGYREEGVRYAVEKGLGVAAMNPLHGGIIANYKDNLSLFKESDKNGVEEGMRFCIESPYINVTLSGMNTVEQVEENTGYAEKYSPLSPPAFEERMIELKSSFDSMCTSCGYCVAGCPESINIPAYMEAYNAHLITGSLESASGRLQWNKNHGLLQGRTETAADCIECGACDEVCTQYLDVMKRLAWVDKNIEAAL